MKNLFLLISDALMKEPRRGCRGFIIFWRKIVYVTAIIAIVGVFLQSFVFPYPLQNWFLVPPPTTSSNDDLHSTFHVEGTFPPAVLAPFPPIISSNSSNAISAIIPPVRVMEVRAEVSLGKGRDHVDTNKITPPVPVIEVRAEASHEKGKDHVDTNKITPPVPVIEVKAEASHGKGKDPVDTNKITPQVPAIEVRAEASHEKGKDHVDTNKITPPVPLIEVRVEASHGMGKDHVDTNEKNPDKPEVVIQPSPKLVVPHQRDIWSLPPDEALVYAKKELEHAPIVTNDPDLYAPLFRNVSIFKRSYELMENILKVFIYKDGKRPIFHHPHLKGIYASEGWFMKLVEENRQFVTRDPKRAHLFYLPYSSRQLELALYVPESHNVKPLAIFLRNYVNMIAAKYPFWNRTRGADHFLVACHDWGPYTVTEHKELLRNSIKALCAADLSEGIFVPGRDVSLPETTIRRPRKPSRGIGGKRVSQRPILAFFAGNMHGRVRPNLVRYWRDRDEDMRIYGPLPNRVARNMSYAVHMKSSKFCICPMGFEVNSPRIVEAIYNECVPVIIADNFVLPFSDVLEWNSFSLVVAEKDIPKLKDILLAVPMRRYLWMQTNVKMLQKHFLWNPIPIKYDLFHMVLHSIWFNRLNQIQVQHQQ